MRNFYLMIISCSLLFTSVNAQGQGSFDKMWDNINFEFNIGPQKKEKKPKEKFPVISSIHRSFHKTTVTLNNNNTFIVSAFLGNDVSHWMEDQRIKIAKSDDFLYPITLTNIDTGDSVSAKRPGQFDL